MKKEPALFTSLQKASMDKGRSKFFLFFLLFSFVLWFIAKFSKEYTEIISLEMALENIPATIIPSIQNSPKIEFTLKATGFQFLYYQFLDNRLKINMQDANFESGRAILPIAAQFQDLQEQLLGETEIVNYFPAIIEFDYQEQSTKRIALVTPDFKMALGYAITLIQFKPDSIEVIGPKDKIKSIETIQPIYESNDPIKASFESQLNLSSNDPLITISDNRVSIKVEVDRFSETKYHLPIQMINVPSGAVFKFFPSQVSVTFSAPLNILRNISPEDFKIGADYNQLSQNNKSVILKVFSSPEGTTNLRIDPKQVQYLMRQ
jgi:YbbR domain-containing protein